MKKIKTLAAFLLSLTLLTPLFACNKENLDTSSPQISSSEEVSADSENTPDSSSENEEEEFDIATWEVPDDFFDEVDKAEDKGK